MNPTGEKIGCCGESSAHFTMLFECNVDQGNHEEVYTKDELIELSNRLNEADKNGVEYGDETLYSK
jgi:hypothetical protein